MISSCHKELCLLKVHINKLCGVRLGGVLSRVLFAIYVDNLIVKFRDSGEGCCINGLYLGCVMYAGDIVLLLASLTSLPCSPPHFTKISHIPKFAIFVK